MTGLKKRIALVFLTLVLAAALPEIASDRGDLQARSGTCACGGTAYGHTYAGAYVGSQGSGWFAYGTATDNVQCAASFCQGWIWSVGASVCSAYSLRGGVGYVILDWVWAFQNDSGGYVQPYDCDAL